MKRFAIAAAVLVLVAAPSAHAQSFLEDMARRAANELANRAGAAIGQAITGGDGAAASGVSGPTASPRTDDAPAVMRPRPRKAADPQPSEPVSAEAQAPAHSDTGPMGPGGSDPSGAPSR